ncbi:MAG TPA: alanine--tRNA ligase [Gaiellaceae bacterium]|nr:alanine--tRNA ligase [Gaiellaceae bacterium]
MTTNELREAFLAFFEERGHLRCPSYSLIPRADDHSTLLTSAGMQPQMPFFLGRETPPAPLTTTAQKVFRTVDIDEVGRDTFHLTFFEMMGNFSFGRYFKQGAIEYARDFLTDRLRLDWDRLWVSVHAGDPQLGLGPDEVAIEHWLRVGMPRERIVPLPSSENFWSVGGPGPCGPDSEIYFDWGEETGCGEPDCLPGCTRCERFLEFWNLVFMEYELHPDNTLTPLPKQNIDTGLGLERTARILQNVPSVYDTDGYQAIMGWIGSQSGVAYGETPDATKAHRVLADHGRGMTFIVAEGVTPTNEGRGYVLRRIVRRAVQHGLRIGLESPFLPGLADAVIEQMGDAYPELVERRSEIHEVLAAEEERFAETLARGMRVFAELAADDAVSGDDAFTLATTYGFPIELTQELAEERGQSVDVDRYRSLMEEHREVSRAGGDRSDLQRAADFAAGAGFRSDFVGYAKTDVLTQVGALEELGDGTFLCKLRESPFYPEGGGQVTDAGELVHEDSGAVATLRAAYRIGDDQALLFEGEGFAAGDRVRAVVPWSTRFPTMANHTATHLLHAALRHVLGDHVRQAGSAVRPDKLRFDFTHPQALSADQRDQVERIVNEKVFEAIPVRTFVTPIEEARKLGAMMLFGEKYGEEVRVVEIDGFSRELCGGTHVRSTAEIGPFVLLAERAVGSGVRRVEAVTSGEGWSVLEGRSRELDAVRLELEQARRDAKTPKEKAAAAGPDIVWQDRQGPVLVAEVSGARGGALRDLSDQLRQREDARAVVLASADEGKVALVVNLDRSLAEIDAVRIVRELGPIIGGGGGGRATLAEAGGRNVDAVRAALTAGRDRLAAAIGS